MIITKWEPGVVTSQGKNPTCTGHAWYAALRCRWGDDIDSPTDLYRLGYNHQHKTNAGAGSKGLYLESIGDALQSQGLITGTRQLRTPQGCIQALKSGPILMSVPWFQSFTAWDRTILQLEGSPLGHHAVAVLDADSVRGIVLQNSHGLNWGNQGRAFLSRRVLEAGMRSPNPELRFYGLEILF